MSLKRIITTLFLLFISVILFFPRNYAFFKFPLLLILIILSIYFQVHNNIKLNKQIIFFYILLELPFLFSSLYASPELENTINFLRVFVIFPICFYFIFLCMFDKMVCENILKVFVLLGLIISIYNILFILLPFFSLSNTFLSFLDPQARFGIHDGYLQLTAHNIGMLSFLFPLSLCLWYYDAKICGEKVVLISVILQLFTILISGRRILWLIVFFSFFLLLFYNLLFSKFRNKKNILLFIVLIIIFFIFLFVFKIDIPKLIERFMGIFDNKEQSVRHGQIDMFNQEFAKKPFFGSGLGGRIIEISYIRMVVDMGIIGFSLFIFYCTFLILLLYYSAKQDKKNFYLYISVLTGFICFIIANATNPYMFSFDFVWLLLFPVNFVFSMRNE